MRETKGKRPPRNYVRIDHDLGADERMQDIKEEYFLAACGLHVLAIGYCDRKRTDGRLSRKAFRLLAPAVPEEVVRELVRVGVWHENPEGELTIRSYLRWQKSRAEIEQLSIQASDAASTRWAKEKAAKRSAERTADAHSHADTNADSDTDPDSRTTDIDLRGFEEAQLLEALRRAFEFATGETLSTSTVSSLLAEFGPEVVTLVVARIVERVDWYNQEEIRSPVAYLRGSCRSEAYDCEPGCRDYTNDEVDEAFAAIGEYA